MVAGLGIGLGQPAPHHHRRLGLVPIERQRLHDGGAAGIDAAARQLDFTERDPERRVGAGGLRRQVGTGLVQIAAGHVGQRKARPDRDVGRIGFGDLAKDLQHRIALPRPLEGGGNLLQLGRATGDLARQVRGVARYIRVKQPRARAFVGLIDVEGGLQRSQCLGAAVLLLVSRGNLAKLAKRGRGIAGLGGQVCGAQSRFQVVGIQGAEANRHFGGALPVTPGLALVGDRLEVLLRVGEGPLPRGDVARLQQRVLVVWLELEDLLEERRRLGEEPFGRQVIGDAGELLKALV